MQKLLFNLRRDGGEGSGGAERPSTACILPYFTEISMPSPFLSLSSIHLLRLPPVCVLLSAEVDEVRDRVSQARTATVTKCRRI